MPELCSGIVAALLENLYKVHSLCKHNCELSISSLIAAHAKKDAIHVRWRPIRGSVK